MSEAPFHRWIAPADKGAVRSVHRIEASEAERATLAEWLDIPAVNALTAELTVTRAGTDSAKVAGSFRADLTLTCGVSLDPFEQRIDGEIEHEFRRPDAVSRAGREDGEVVVNLDTEEPGEWRPQGIDLGALLAEELSLALPDFPRKPDAELEGAPDEVPADEKPNPFAALAKLKRDT